MVQRIPLVGLTLCAFAPSACDRAIQTQSPDPSSTLPPTIAEPDARSDCRVIVNGPERVLDVTIHADGSPPVVEAQTGSNVMVVEGRTIALTTHFRGVSSTHVRVAVEELPEGIDEVLDTYAGDFGEIDETIADCVDALSGHEPKLCRDDFYTYDSAGVSATLGPYLSFTTQVVGYVGGVDRIQGFHVEMWNLGGPEPVEVEVLALVGEPGREALAQALTRSLISEYAEVELDDYYDGHLSIGNTGALEVTLGFGFRFWGYNHTHFELYATMSTPPPELAAYLPDPKTGRWTRKGCGSVDLEGVVRDIDGEVLAELGAEAIGVYWIDPSFDLSLSDLPHPGPVDHQVPPEAKTEPLGPLGQRLMETGRYDEAASVFELAYQKDKSPDWLAELCWAEFELRDYERAEAACMEALREAPDRRALAAVIYALGRIAEATGDIEAAIGRYETSLELRPDAVVEASLAKLK